MTLMKTTHLFFFWDFILAVGFPSWCNNTNMIDPKLDCSSGIDTSHPQTRKEMQQYMKDLNLCEPWRSQNPSKREFSCYPKSFESHSRIDSFLISFLLPPNISTFICNSIISSDHATNSLFYNDAQLNRHFPVFLKIQKLNRKRN